MTTISISLDGTDADASHGWPLDTARTDATASTEDASDATEVLD